MWKIIDPVTFEVFEEKFWPHKVAISPPPTERQKENAFWAGMNVSARRLGIK
jgi:hypothetical protein